MQQYSPLIRFQTNSLLVRQIMVDVQLVPDLFEALGYKSPSLGLIEGMIERVKGNPRKERLKGRAKRKNPRKENGLVAPISFLLLGDFK